MTNPDRPHFDPIDLALDVARDGFARLRDSLQNTVHSPVVETHPHLNSDLDEREISDAEAAQATADAAMRHAEIYHQRPYLGRF